MPLLWWKLDQVTTLEKVQVLHFLIFLSQFFAPISFNFKGILQDFKRRNAKFIYILRKKYLNTIEKILAWPVVADIYIFQ